MGETKNYDENGNPIVTTLKALFSFIGWVLLFITTTIAGVFIAIGRLAFGGKK